MLLQSPQTTIFSHTMWAGPQSCDRYCSVCNSFSPVACAISLDYMNAIVSLCHFCEAHGPCILFCTQAFHQSRDAQLLLDSAPLDRRGPRPAEVVTDNVLPSHLIQPPHKSDQCDACRSVPVDKPGFISYDPKPQITYVSGQYPEQPQLYSILRQACVRSLNCEVCPGREGPIVFGEDNSCHVLSHTFNLRDSQARGFNRLYSFIVVMMDRVFLINSWPFLVRHFRALIDTLQDKAEKIYSQESEEHRAISLSLRSGPPGPGDHLRRIRSNQIGRSLVELTGDKDVFVYLHKYFVFLLKTGGKRLTECIVEGPPQAMAIAEQVRVLSDQELLDHKEDPVSASEFRVVQCGNQPIFRSIRHVMKILDVSDFQELSAHIMRGDQLIVRGSDVSTVTSVLNVLKELLPANCCNIVGFSSSYQESYRCNFLGLSVGVNLPEHIVNSEFHVLLDILPPLKRYYSLSADATDYSNLEEEEEASSLEQYKLMVYSAQPRQPDQKYPLIIQRLISIVCSDVFSDALVSRAIQNLKEEWMNKVKVFYKFCLSESKDGSQKDERLTKLLKDILLVPPEDLPILRHWRSALNKDYRSHLLQKDTSPPKQ